MLKRRWNLNYAGCLKMYFIQHTWSFTFNQVVDFFFFKIIDNRYFIKKKYILLGNILFIFLILYITSPLSFYVLFVLESFFGISLSLTCHKDWNLLLKHNHYIPIYEEKKCIYVIFKVLIFLFSFFDHMEKIWWLHG